MKKTKVVQFSRNAGARIFVNPENLEELSKRSDCLVDPDLREVIKVPTCFWKMKGHAAVAMNDAEMEEVRENYKALGNPYTSTEVKRLRHFFLSKNVFRKFLEREREDFQYLIIRESKMVSDRLKELEGKITHNSKDLQILVQDTIANFLDIYTVGYAQASLAEIKRLENRISYKFNVILFVLLGMILMGVIYVLLKRS